MTRLLSTVSILLFSCVLAQAEETGKYLVRTDRIDYKPGEKIRFSLQVERPEDLSSAYVVMWGKSGNLGQAYFTKNENTGLFQTEMTVPELLNTPTPTFDVVTHSKASNSVRLESGKDFDAPVIRGAKVDDQPPTVSNVRITPADGGKKMIIKFQARDNQGLESGYSVFWDKSHNAGQAYMKYDSESGEATIEADLPKTISDKDAFNMDLVLNDKAQNSTRLNSSTGFNVDWSKFQLSTDNRQIKIDTVKVISCGKDMAIIEMTTSGPALSSGYTVIWGKSANLGQSYFECKDGHCTVNMKFPKYRNASDLRVDVVANAENGSSDRKNLPAGSIDFSPVPLDEKACRVTYLGIENPLLRHETVRPQPNESEHK